MTINYLSPIGPIPMLNSVYVNAQIEYDQQNFQLLCQFYPWQNLGYYLSFGADYILMKTKFSFKTEESGPYVAMSSFTSEGSDHTLGLVIGAGLALPIFQNNIYLTADINYSLANYKGDKLIGDPNSSEDAFSYEENLKMDLAVGGVSANIGLRMYLTGTKEIGVSKDQGQKISLNKISFIPNAGIAKTVGDGSEYWKLGFSAGADIFYESTSTISLGGRIAYNRIFPNGEKIMDLSSGIPGASYDYQLQNTSGGLSVIELVPSARIALSPPADSIGSNLFLQCGAGLFFIDSDASATGKYESATVTSTMKISLKGQSGTKPGLQVGLGLNVGNRMSILSLFSIIFNEEEEMKYVSLNLGINLGN